jgi:hypothetical protein
MMIDQDLNYHKSMVKQSQSVREVPKMKFKKTNNYSPITNNVEWSLARFGY